MDERGLGNSQLGPGLLECLSLSGASETGMGVVVLGLTRELVSLGEKCRETGPIKAGSGLGGKTAGGALCRRCGLQGTCRPGSRCPGVLCEDGRVLPLGRTAQEGQAHGVC